jgi:hypothetical protein
MECAHDVRLDEIARPGDGTIDVTLSRKVHHMSDGMLAHNSNHGLLVPQILLLECVSRIGRHIVEVLQTPRVGKAIEIHQSLHLLLLQNVAYHVAPDEASAAGDK